MVDICSVAVLAPEGILPLLGSSSSDKQASEQTLGIEIMPIALKRSKGVTQSRISIENCQ